MPNEVINLADWIKEQDRKPLTLIQRYRRLRHAKKALAHQLVELDKKKRKTVIDKIARSILAKSDTQPQAEETTNERP